MSLEDEVVGNEVSSPEIADNDGVIPKLSPFEESGVLIEDFTFFEVQRRAGVRARDLDEGLVKIVRVVNVTLQSHKSLEGISENFGMAESVGDIVVSLVIRSFDIILVTLIMVVLLVDWAVCKLLRPFNIVVSHLRSLLGEDLLMTI